jgi:hypothetical protein
MRIIVAGQLRLLITGLSAAAALTACGAGGSSALPSSSPSPAATSAAGTGTGSAQAAATATAAGTGAQPSAAAAGGSSVNVCSLLSSAQASSINHVTYGAATDKELTSNWNQCTYANKGSVDPVDIQALNVSVISMPGCWDSLRSADGPGTAVSGVGDEAFGYEIGFDVRTGSTCVTIQGLTHAEFNGDHSRDEAIAKIVLAGLH